MRRLIACGVMVLSVAGVAAGQQGEEPALRGPRVREQRVPGNDQGFSGERRGERMGQQAVPPGAFMAALAKLRSGEAPEELRLTPEQQEKIQQLGEKMRGTMRDGDRPRPTEEMREQGAEGQRARRERAAQLAPQAIEFQTKAFAVLSEKQREFVSNELAKARERMEKERGEQMMERRLRERAPEGAPARPDQPGADRPARAPGEPGGPLPRERLRHIAELLGQLPPDERDQFLSRIEAALEKRVGEQLAAPEEAPKSDRPAPPEQPRRRRGNPPR